MEHHHKEPTPKAEPTKHGADSGGPQRSKVRDYLVLAASLALPIPLIVMFVPTQGKYAADLMVCVFFAYILWAATVAGPTIRRIYSVADERFCTPLREIAAWRLDSATLAEFRRGQRRRFPWTWPF